MSYTVIIPARMHSTRLPEKLLRLIAGIPMVVHVAQAAARTEASRVVVATDHQKILDVCQDFDIEAVLTREDHPTGTDRLAETVDLLKLPEDEVVVNVQGDEPLIPVETVNAVANLLQSRTDCAIATAAHPISNLESFKSPNVVKVLTDISGTALLFSRAPIPWPRDLWRKDPLLAPEDFIAMHHIGLYAYRSSFLRLFPTLKQAPIEKTESLEQLRALYYGYKIAVLKLTQALPAGVDTEEDLTRVCAWFEMHAQ